MSIVCGLDLHRQNAMVAMVTAVSHVVPHPSRQPGASAYGR